VTVSEDGLVESYSVQLNTRPKNPVTITITPDGQTTANKSTLTFNAGSWNVAQTVIVGAVNDAIAEPSPHTGQVGNISASNDPDYDGIQFIITANITDNDTAGVIVTPLSLDITEGEPLPPSYSLRLTSQPTSAVTITLALNPSGQFNANPTLLVFAPGDWNTPQNVQVTAIDDFIDEDTMSASIVHTAQSSDPNYNGIAIDDLSVTIYDNDTAGISATPSTVSVSEAGVTAVYTIQLNTQPTGSVTVLITQNAQATTNPIQVTFNTGNWNTPQQVTVFAVDDDLDEGLHSTLIAHNSQSTDPKYNAIAFNITAEITDNDFAGLTIQPTELDVSEGSPGQTYIVVLNSSYPTGDHRPLLRCPGVCRPCNAVL
jgi:hypothetical protein